MSKDLFEALSEVMDSWGVCSICDAEHAWANVKCDLLFEPAGVCGRCGYEPCASEAIDPACTPENYLSIDEEGVK